MEIISFKIFRADADYSREPLARAEDVDRAMARVEMLGIIAPGQYVIVSERTGNRFYVDADTSGHLTLARTQQRD